MVAVKLSLIGNIIDYRAKSFLNVEEEIDHPFKGNFMINNENNLATFKYDQFTGSLNKGNNIIYLADNAGEVGFDKLLIEELIEELGNK